MYLPKAIINEQKNTYVCLISDPGLEDSLECYVECASQEEVLGLLVTFVYILSDQYWEGYEDGADEILGGGDIDLL